MRISHLQIFGFKSFYQKVEIPFGAGITAVVGPNGCGKSNIVEAIRWVLGEQRAGAVRGHRMEDVIFAGSRQRKALGMAEVSVTIDNSGQDLPIDFSEVTITRRLFRSGESDYLLNRVPCRLLDIQNLLMDTGLGPGAYSVMEQGMVDEIISEKTENRRRILEEAAGITKYKARRRSTWSKLESTNADLTRLEDIISEVKRQVDYLGRQVGRARRYQQYKQELDELEALFARHSYFTIQAELRPIEEEFAALTRASETGLTEFTAREAELERRRLAVADAEQALQEVGVQLTRCIEEIHQWDGQLISSRERRESREQFIERHTADRGDGARQLAASQKQQADTAGSLAEAQRYLDASAEEMQAREAKATAAEKRYADRRASLDEENRQLRDLLREKGERSSRLERIHTEREGLERQDSELEGEIAQLSQVREHEETRQRQAEEELQHLQVRIGEVAGDGTAARGRLEEVDLTIGDLGEARADMRRSIQADEARIAVLERVRSGYEGYSSGVRSLMVDSPYRQLFGGVLGDLIDVEPRYYRAVETVLGDASEALVATSDEGVLDAIRYLQGESGRAGVFPLNWQGSVPTSSSQSPPPDVPGLVGPLSDFVRTEDAIAPLIARLLHNTYLVEDLATVMGQADALLDRGMRFVSPTGEGIDVQGRVSGGQVAAEDDSVLGRGREVLDLRSGIARQRARLTTLDLSLRSQEARRAILRGYIGDLEGLLAELRQSERDLGLRASSAATEMQRLEAAIGEMARRRAEANARREEQARRAATEATRLTVVEGEAASLETRLREGGTELQAAEQDRLEQRQSLGDLQVKRARMTEQADGLQRDVERLSHLERSYRANIARLDSELAQATEDRRNLLERETEITAEIARMHEHREGLQEDRNNRQEHHQDVLVRSRELEEEISRMQRELSARRDRRHQLELRISELRTQSDQIRQRLLEGHHLDVVALGQIEDEAFDAEGAELQLQQLRRSIERLGAVHVGVLEEYEEQKERHDFLAQQRDDLTAAAEDLRKTLQLIDRTARRMFREIFEEIRQKFRTTFGRFFPGGEADLILQADVDPLESTIEISARPRGKRLQSINLLSGGEKALTAIALLFAIYQVKPSPFCILDEVDAPLDDANIDRFLDVLREFATYTQFIMVTHNKLSMAAADIMHGVTMPEEGVSQLVSVQMAEEQMDEAAG